MGLEPRTSGIRAGWHMQRTVAIPPAEWHIGIAPSPRNATSHRRAPMCQILDIGVPRLFKLQQLGFRRLLIPRQPVLIRLLPRHSGSCKIVTSQNCSPLQPISENCSPLQDARRPKRTKARPFWHFGILGVLGGAEIVIHTVNHSKLTGKVLVSYRKISKNTPKITENYRKLPKIT